MKYYLKALRHYADFNGRASRREYWMYILFNIIFTFAAMIPALIATLIADSDFDDTFTFFTAYFIKIYQFAVIIPTAALTVRRLHDSGKNSWWLLLLLPACVFAVLKNLQSENSDLTTIIGIIVPVCSVALIVLMLPKGNKDINRYGENPETVKSVYSRHARQKSIAVTLIIVETVLIIIAILPVINGFLSFSQLLTGHIWVNILILIAGILLLPRTGKPKAAGMALLITALVCFALLVIQISQITDYRITIDGILFILKEIALSAALLFAGMFLFRLDGENKTIPANAKIASVFMFVFAVLSILLKILFMIKFSVRDNSIFNVIYVISPVAFLVFAWYLRRQGDVHEELQTESADAGNADIVQAEPQQSLGWKIFGLVVSIGLIGGGLSGEMVLRGTESSTALIVVGSLLLVADIYSIATHKKKKN